MAKEYILALINLFYPNHCLFDGIKLESTDKFPLCETCFKKIKFITSPVCVNCGTPMQKEKENRDIKVLNFVCRRCASTKNWFRFVRSACIYEGIIKDCIHLFKYKKKVALRKLFAMLLMRSFKSHLEVENYDLIIAVPMHPFKKFLREFNHSEILAYDLSLNSGIKYLKRGLKRIKFTKSQTALNSLQRKKNIKGVFSLPKPRQIRRKKILLIDDVATTLSTVNECAKLLVSDGAKFVDVLTVGRG